MKIQIYRWYLYFKEEACLQVTGLTHGVRACLVVSYPLLPTAASGVVCC